MRVYFHQRQSDASLIQQRLIHPPLQEKKIKNTKWSPENFCFQISKTTYPILYLIKNMDTYLPRKVLKSGEHFGNYILSAMILREPQG